MILTTIFANVRDLADIHHYHVETALVNSDDLHKKILRVTTDHHNEYGIRLDDENQQLENGSTFTVGDKKLLVLQVIPDTMLVIRPTSMKEMGTLAHMLGNLHKPVEVTDNSLSLLYDPVVEDTLKKQGVDYTVEKRALDTPLSHLNLSHHHHEH